MNMIEFTKDELYEIEKLLDLQRTQLVEMANRVAHTLIIAESDEEKHKDKIDTLKLSFEQIQKSIENNMIVIKKRWLESVIIAEVKDGVIVIMVEIKHLND
jgi:hypothetical protein